MADVLYRCSLVVVPRLAAGLLRVWFATCRVQLQGEAEFRQGIGRDTGIGVFWHYSFLYFFYSLRKYPAAVMVSASRDGEYIAQLARLLGHVPVRGSSNRGGVRALRQMIDLLRQGWNSAIVADGSQGPARRVQPGCILMASKSGKPIFPMAWAADHCLIFNSWDRTVVPLPFATIALHYGPALVVPPDLGPEQVEQYRLELEQRLNHLYDQVWQAVGRPAHDGGLAGAATVGKNS